MRASIICATTLALAMSCLPLSADEDGGMTSAPGFRPECTLASQFTGSIGTATVRVYPTVIRTPTNTTFSIESQQQIVAFLNGKSITRAVADDQSINPGEITGHGQFQWFQNDMKAISRELQTRKAEEDYVLVMEVLFPPTRDNRLSVFGVHCIILDKTGKNAFSFLLNSHHQMFADAGMVANDRSEKSRAELIRKATTLGMEALVLQIRNAAPEQTAD